jgi:hypothetical protein
MGQVVVIMIFHIVFVIYHVADVPVTLIVITHHQILV